MTNSYLENKELLSYGFREKVQNDGEGMAVESRKMRSHHIFNCIQEAESNN